MKVIHISTSKTGGGGIAAYRLHLALEECKNIESYFVCQHNYLDKKEKEEHNLFDLEPKRNLYYKLKRKLKLVPEIQNWKTVNQAPVNYEIITFPTTSYRVEDLDIVKEADIIHLHWVAGFVNYPTFFKKIKQPIVWTLHDKNPFHGLFHTESDEAANCHILGEIDTKIMLEKVKYIHQHKNISIVTPSDWLKKKSEQSITFKQYPHYLIPNSIDLSRCKINKQEAKKVLNFDNGNVTLMFIAHSVEIPRRGFSLLIQALDNLRNYSNINLISVGGNKVELNRKDINHIHYPTTHDHDLLNTFYSASDAMILPTREDNLPNVMLESFANGTPVISFSNGGMAEHIHTGVNGILIDQINSDALTRGIEDFLNKKYTFDENVIRQYAKDHFSPAVQTKSYTNLYESLLV